MKFGVVILAAGASSRMGRPKMLLPWGNISVVGHLLDTWRQLAAAQVGVVCAATDLGLRQELDRLHFPANDRILNPTPERGMFSSMQCAARWDGWYAEISHWLIALGDQPHLRAKTLRSLIQFGMANPDNICQPVWDGRPRHPVWLPKAAFLRIGASPVDNLRHYLQNSLAAIKMVECIDPGLGIDIDHPADYETARNLYFNRGLKDET